MRFALPLAVAAALTLSSLSAPANAATESAPAAAPPPRPVAASAVEHGAADRTPLKAGERPPVSPVEQKAPEKVRRSTADALAAAAECDTADFTGNTGTALVNAVKAAETSCVNTLFSLTGTAARDAFREAQMVTVATALRDNAAAYPGDNSTSTLQLVMFLRAGYYVQWYNSADVGEYGTALRTAIRAALDAFYGNSRSSAVSEANGEILSEAVILIDSSAENARYLYVVKRLLAAYTTGYGWYMTNAVNSVYTVLFRGHQLPEFVTAVQADTGLLTALRDFAVNHLDLLTTDNGFLTSNAGRELARFVQHAPLQAAVRPMLRDLLQRTQITGPTAGLWVGVAEMADYYDSANCSYYGTCDLANRLRAAALPVDHTCSPSLRIRAQEMTAAQLAGTCSSLANQDAYFHDIARDDGPVAGDGNTTLEVNVFDSSTDYQTYAGAIFGIDTNNGGMYLEGDPAAAGNTPRFIAYEAEWLRPDFQIWNLNHEYTHYLDGRFNMYGDFGAGVSTPTIWWIEGFAEFVSYGYRGEIYDAAIAEAGRHAYTLSTLFDTTYDHDTQRVYRWGYLAVRYMVEKRRAALDTVLGHYRSGNWNAARTYLKSLDYDADFDAWLTACAAGACAGGGGGDANKPPTASFTVTASGLTASFTDTSTDPDGTVATRSWDFGDGTTATTANPVKTYAAAGTYAVKLTVTDDKGATATATRNVAVSSGTPTPPECAGGDQRVLGKNCQRSGRSAARNDYAYFYLQIPPGTARLTITASGGTGDADLYYNGFSWATRNAYHQSSTGAGNTHTITVVNPPAGYNYVSLYGVTAFSGVTVSTSY